MMYDIQRNTAILLSKLKHEVEVKIVMALSNVTAFVVTPACTMIPVPSSFILYACSTLV